MKQVAATFPPSTPRFGSAVHAVLAAALLGLWMSGTASMPVVLLLAAVLVWAMWRARRGVVASERTEFAWNVAAVGYLAVYAADLLVISHNLLGASLRLLVFLSVQRLLAARTDRDRIQLLLISFLAIVSATAATTEFTFALPLTLYVVAALRALACRQIDKAGEPRPRARGPNRRVLAVWTGSILVLGTVVFFLIPHVGTGYFRPGGGRGPRLSGFSGSIELGSINSIKKNHELAMRVRVDAPPPGGIPLRWRGLAFDTYDGRTWSRSTATMRYYGWEPGGFTLEPPPEGPTFDYEVILEPMGTSALFAAASPVLIESEDFPRLFRDAEDGLHRDARLRSRAHYVVHSELRSAERLGRRLAGIGRDYPSRIAQSYLAVPPVDPRIRLLSDEIAGGTTDPYEILMRIQRRLRGHYTSTLDVNDAGVADPLARFLLDDAPGHCEYFATAMAVLARMQGIPARVVVGFLQGEYSDLQRTYLVRQSDAHSWVEAYFPGRGWVGFDPTPPVPEAGAATWLARLRRMTEQMEIAWDTWIVGLDLNDQASILGTLRDGAARGLDWLSRGVSGTLRSAASMRRVAWAALGLFVVAGLVAAARTFVPVLRQRLRVRRPASVRPDETDRVVEMYVRFLAALRRHGIDRPATWTPLEFAGQAAAGGDGRAAAVGEVTTLFCRARYGGAGLTAAEVQRIESLIARIRGA